MRITRRQLRRIIFETAPTFGLRSGDTVRHKDEPERGTGKVVAKGSTRDRSISVIWSDGSRQRHDPSALVKEAKMRITRRQLRRIIKEEIKEEKARLLEGKLSAQSSAQDIADVVMPLIQSKDWASAAETLMGIMSYHDIQLEFDDGELGGLLFAGDPFSGEAIAGARDAVEDAAWKIRSKQIDDAINADPDKGWLKFLGNQWSATVEPDDLATLGWKEYKEYIRLSPPQSISHGVDEIHITNLDLSVSGLPGTRQDFVDFLTKRAGKTLKKRKISRPTPPLYD